MRKLAREATFKLIYQSMFINDDEQSVSLIFEDMEEKDKDFATNLYQKFKENKAEIEKILEANVKGYEVARIYKVDVALLYLGITEIKYATETPPAVVVNEIVDIAKRYSTDKSYSFINAVMSSILKG